MIRRPAQNSHLTLLLAFAIMPTALLMEQRMAPAVIGATSVIGATLGCILWLTTLALLIVPPLQRSIPWPQRIQSALLRLLFWSIFVALTGYAFGVGKE